MSEMNIDFVFFYLSLLAYLLFNVLRVFKEILKKNASPSQKNFKSSLK